MSKHRVETKPKAMELLKRLKPTKPVEPPTTDLRDQVRQILVEELSHFLEDVEFRLAQTQEHERRIRRMAEGKEHEVVDKVYAEDLVVTKFMLTGYTVTANSPSAGSIAWASLHVVYNGVDYTITNGNTNLKYVWFDAAVSTTVLQTSNTKPTLTGNATLIWVNNAGTPVDAMDTGLPPAVGNNAVDAAAILAGAVGTTAIANGAVGNTQLGTGLDGSKLSAGTVANTQLATGIDGAKLTAGSVANTQLATGIDGAKLTASSVTSTQIGAGAITPVKLNTLQHILY